MIGWAGYRKFIKKIIINKISASSRFEISYQQTIKNFATHTHTKKEANKKCRKNSYALKMWKKS